MTLDRACANIIGHRLSARIIAEKGLTWCIAVAARAIVPSDDKKSVSEIDQYLDALKVRR